MNRIFNNNIHRISIISFLFLTLVFHAASGQEQLTLSEAVKIALDNNISLQQESNRLDIFQANRSAAYANMAPEITVSGNYGKTKGNQWIEQEAQLIDSERTFVNGFAEANLTLFNGFNRLKTTKRTVNALEAQAHFVERTKETVIRDVANQYLQVLLDEQLLLIARENLENQKEQLRQMQEMVSAGSRAEVDLINQQYQVKNAELDVLRGEITLTNDKATLSQLLLLDPNKEFDVVEPTWELSEFAYETYEKDSLVEVALQQRADLKQAESTEEATKYALQAQRGAYLPNLSAFYNYQSFYNKLGGEAASRNFDQQFFTDNVRNSYGLALFIPVFTGFQNRAQVAAAKVAYQNSQLEKKGLENTMKLEVIRAYQNLQDAIKAYEVTRSQEEAAALNFQLQEERYNLQSSSYVEYVQANSDYVTAKGSFAQAKYILLFQDFMLQFALGTLGTEDIPTN
jgi:outer membrane protein